MVLLPLWQRSRAKMIITLYRTVSSPIAPSCTMCILDVHVSGCQQCNADGSVSETDGILVGLASRSMSLTSLKRNKQVMSFRERVPDR
jgi:hypothetical protein